MTTDRCWLIRCERLQGLRFGRASQLAQLTRSSPVMRSYLRVSLPTKAVQSRGSDGVVGRVIVVAVVQEVARVFAERPAAELLVGLGAEVDGKGPGRMALLKLARLAPLSLVLAHTGLNAQPAPATTAVLPVAAPAHPEGQLTLTCRPHLPSGIRHPGANPGQGRAARSF